MKPIFDGVFAKFDETPRNNLWTSVNGRMYPAEAEQRAEFPYIAYDISKIRGRTFELKYDTYRVSFNIFSDKVSGVEAQTIFGYLDDLYGDDSLTLTFTGYTFIRMDLDFVSQPIKVPASVTGSKNVWQISSDYTLLAGKY